MVPMRFHAFAAAALCCSFSAQADSLAGDVLTLFYGPPGKPGCWIATGPEGRRYCMAPELAETRRAADGTRLYVLARGEAIPDRESNGGSHALSGLVGAFVVQGKGGQLHPVAADPAIPLGTWGKGPKGWKLVQLGPSDYWGFLGHVVDGNQGELYSCYSILAPYGKGIKDLAGFSKGHSNEGACGDPACKGGTTAIDSAATADSTRPGEKVWPLLVTVSGKEKGRQAAPRKWTFTFDDKAWSYVEPQNWPLRRYSCR